MLWTLLSTNHGSPGPAPGLAPQPVAEHLELEGEVRRQVGEEEDLGEGDVGTVPIHHLHTRVEYLNT